VFSADSSIKTRTIPYLPAGSGGTLTLIGKVTTGSVGMMYVNMVQITSTTAELNPADNIATATTVIANVANLYTTANLPAHYSPGTTITAQIGYGNNGNQTTNDTQLTVELDSHFTLVAASMSGYILSGNQLHFPLGEVASSTSGQITLQLQVVANPLLVEDDTPLTLTSSLTSQTAELDLSDNLATTQTLPLQ
jgi:hypothetical protein